MHARLRWRAACRRQSFVAAAVMATVLAAAYSLRFWQRTRVSNASSANTIPWHILRLCCSMQRTRYGGHYVHRRPCRYRQTSMQRPT